MPEGLFDFTIDTSSLSSIVCTIGWKTGWRVDFKIDVLCEFQQGDIVPFLRVRFVLGGLWMEDRVDLQLYFLPGGEVDHHVQEDCTHTYLFLSVELSVLLMLRTPSTMSRSSLVCFTSLFSSMLYLLCNEF